MSSHTTTSTPEPLVLTAQGQVVGRRAAYGLEFRGIPYAEAPRGPLRFAAPRRRGSWGDDVRDARFFGDAAPQEPWEEPFGALLRTRSSSEDCLSLNVWTPSVDPQSKHPVMVWIHGGGYADESGSDEPFHGHAFARDGIVLVTVNYRLGVLGFLHVAESFGLTEGSGNYGTLDQIAALEWVQENIAAFGGDPDNVTVFGESAGGWSVSTLLASRRARGLFGRAIAQSGGGDHVLTPDEAQRVTDHYLDLADIRRGDTEMLLEADTRRLLAAQARLFADCLSGGEVAERLLGDRAGLLVCLMPVTTGEVVSAPPTSLVGHGAGHEVDLLLGSNADEYGLYRLFPGGVFSAERMLTLSRQALARRGLDPVAVEAAYRAEVDGDDVAAGEAMETDRFFRLPVLDLAAAHSPGVGSTYLYELTWSPTDLGACHVLDVPLAFDRLDTDMARRLAGGDASRQVASLVHRAWVDFASTGSPDPSARLGWRSCSPTTLQSFRLDERSVIDNRRDETRRRRWTPVHTYRRGDAHAVRD